MINWVRNLTNRLSEVEKIYTKLLTKTENLDTILKGIEQRVNSIKKDVLYFEDTLYPEPKKTHGQDRKTREQEQKIKQMHRCTSPANRSEYMAWLTGYIKEGGTITHEYDYDFSRGDFLIVTDSFEIPPLYGAASVNLIVPKGISIEYGDLGHNNVYYMDGYRCTSGWVPFYKDMSFLKIN